MQTPDNARGRLTDAHMYRWRQNHPDADSSTYNRTWEKYYKSMTEEEALEIEAVQNKIYGPVLRDEVSEVEYFKKKNREWERYLKANRTKKQKQTKGAFGKCKNRKNKL